MNRPYRPRRTQQKWEVNQIVKVGFLSGFRVLAKVPTPGDGMPDYYVLLRGRRVYHFTPHIGLELKGEIA